jgi:transcription elongation factor GreB
VSRYRPPTPPGSKYITPDGAKRLQDELHELWHEERPRVTQAVSEAAAQGDRSENAEYTYGKKKLREIDRRIRFLSKRLDDAVVVKQAEGAHVEVRFGARVAVVDENEKRSVYNIVGPDEANPSEGKISFQSPLGKALMKRKVGDTVTVTRPAGDIDLEVVGIEY